MRILFLDQFSELGGAQMGLRDVMTGVLQRGWHAELMAPGDGALTDFCRENAVPFHRLPLGSYANGAKTAWDAARYSFDMARAASHVNSVVERSGIDLVAANGPRILPAVIGARAAIVFHLHSRLDKRYARAIVGWTLRARPATVICCCRSVASPLLGTRGPESVRIVYNGVPDTGFAPKPSRGPVQIGIVGRIAPEKGHFDFVNAARAVAQSRPDVRFVIYGASLFSAPSYESEVRALARNKPVDFHGWTDDIPRAFRELEILVVPSGSIEATPRVIMEAMAAGTPVIAYPSGGIPELIRHGETGLLTERRDHESLARAIEFLLSDSDVRLRLVRNARREWEARFRVERFQQEMCESFESAVKRHTEKRRQPQAAAAVTGKNDLA